jgi:hypothetical protein
MHFGHRWHWARRASEHWVHYWRRARYNQPWAREPDRCSESARGQLGDAPRRRAGVEPAAASQHWDQLGPALGAALGQHWRSTGTTGRR